MKIRDFAAKELLRIFAIYFMWTLWAYGLMIYSALKILEGEGLSSFRLGNVPIWKFYTVSYIEMAIFAAVLVVAVGIGFYLRYIKYGEEVDFKKKYGITNDRHFSDDMSDAGTGVDD